MCAKTFAFGAFTATAFCGEMPVLALLLKQTHSHVYLLALALYTT